MDRTLRTVLICIILVAASVSVTAIAMNGSEKECPVSVLPILPAESEIAVVGHANPDSDTVLSSITMAHLLCEMGYDAKPYVAGAVNHESRYILEHFGIGSPDDITHLSPEYVVMVDHNNPLQGFAGEKDAAICMVVDHHSPSTALSVIPEVIIRPFGSTCTIVFLLYEQYGVDIPMDIARLLLAGITSDTKNGRSMTTTHTDLEVMKILSDTTGVDIDGFYKEMLEASYGILKESDERLFENDLKSYMVGGVSYLIGSFKSDSEEMLLEVKNRMTAYIRGNEELFGNDMVFFMLVNLGTNTTELLYFGDGASEIIEQAFDRTGDVILENISSRKSQINPAIMEAIESSGMTDAS